MSIRTTGATGRLGRTTNLMDHEGAYTCMMWVYWVTTVGQEYVLSVTNEAGPSYDLIGSNSSAALWLRCYAGGDGDAVGSTLSADTWYHIALVRESVTSLKAYLNGVLDATSTRDVTGRALPDRLDYSGYASGAGSRFDGRGAAFKAWSAALTQAEVAAEMNSYAPVRTSNVHAWTPLQVHTDVADQSGNGYNWTVNGTLTTEADPPIGGAPPVTRGMYTPGRKHGFGGQFGMR